MKVLLIGEFSSLHRFLKNGLIKNGIDDVVIFADSSGWKAIPGIDIPYDKKKEKGFFSRIRNNKRILNQIKSFKDFDVVQLVYTCPFPLQINNKAINYLKKYNGVISLVSAGADLAIVSAYVNNVFDYYVFDGDKTPLQSFNVARIKGIFKRRCDRHSVRKADVIIPSLYEYSIGYKSNKKKFGVIPFPISFEGLEFSNNIPNKKVVFFHGLNNELNKGTSFIKKAMQMLKEKYPDKVEIVLRGHMPYNDYLQVMRRVNVVIDQCQSYGYGINACLAMAMGKVVLSGKRKETLDSFGLTDCPIIEITPNIEQIFKSLEWLLLNKNKIPEIGMLSHQYVKKLHFDKLVASKYLDAWIWAKHNKSGGSK